MSLNKWSQSLLCLCLTFDLVHHFSLLSRCFLSIFHQTNLLFLFYRNWREMLINWRVNTNHNFKLFGRFRYSLLVVTHFVLRWLILWSIIILTWNKILCFCFENWFRFYFNWSKRCCLIFSQHSWPFLPCQWSGWRFFYIKWVVILVNTLLFFLWLLFWWSWVDWLNQTSVCTLFRKLFLTYPRFICLTYGHASPYSIWFCWQS